MLALVIAVAVVLGVVLYIAFRPVERQSVKLVVASRLSAEEAEAIRSAFLASDIAKRFNIIDVEIKKVDYSLWRDLGVRGDVDLFLVGEASIFNTLCEEGAFRVIDMPELLEAVKELPQSFVGRFSNGSVCWIGIGLGVYGFIVNRDFMQRYGLAEPSSWSMLADPSYAKVLADGRYLVSFPLPSKSGTARTTIIAILQRYGWERGWEILTAIGAQSSFVTSSERARDDAAMGVVGAAPAYIGYGLYAENVSKGRAVFVTPKGETIPYVSPAAVASGTKHPREAQAFILWLLSPDAQKLMVNKFGYLPVRSVPGLEELARRTREALKNSMNYSIEFERSIREAVVTYFEASIADPDVQKLLSEAYLKIATTRTNEFGAWLKRLGEPLTIKDPLTGESKVFTFDYAKELTEAIRSGKIKSDDLYLAVKNAAIQRLQSLLKELS